MRARSDPPAPMIARTVPVSLAAAFAAGLAVWNAAAAVGAPGVLRSLAALLPAHSAIVTTQAMDSVAQAAARAQPMPASARTDMAWVAGRAPFRPEPYLVEGTARQMAGDDRAAERLYRIARSLDPRSRAARFLLADRFLRTGRTADGLLEIATLVELEPSAVPAYVQAVADYARQPGSVGRLRELFRLKPYSRDPVLAVLAADARNADLVLALAPAAPAAIPLDAGWRIALVDNLIAAGQAPRARLAWLRLNGIRQAGPLFNAGFRPGRASPPFDWNLATGPAGVAEPADGEGLNVIAYGRESAPLASQALALPPGRYRLSWQVTGEPDSAATWVVICAPAGTTAANSPLARPGPASVLFAIAGDCPGQRLELRAVAADSPATKQFSIHRLRLDGTGQ